MSDFLIPLKELTPNFYEEITKETFSICNETDYFEEFRAAFIFLINFNRDGLFDNLGMTEAINTFIGISFNNLYIKYLNGESFDYEILIEESVALLKKDGGKITSKEIEKYKEWYSKETYLNILNRSIRLQKELHGYKKIQEFLIRNIEIIKKDISKDNIEAFQKRIKHNVMLGLDDNFWPFVSIYINLNLCHQMYPQIAQDNNDDSYCFQHMLKLLYDGKNALKHDYHGVSSCNENFRIVELTQDNSRTKENPFINYNMNLNKKLPQDEKPAWQENSSKKTENSNDKKHNNMRPISNKSSSGCLFYFTLLGAGILCYLLYG